MTNMKISNLKNECKKYDLSTNKYLSSVIYNLKMEIKLKFVKMLIKWKVILNNLKLYEK